ncbi:MAG: hypothetical protein LDLANPLL_02302 [Turneriella sp.]|nr:hypothetical protein [Turneriella sp.]
MVKIFEIYKNDTPMRQSVKDKILLAAQECLRQPGACAPTRAAFSKRQFFYKFLYAVRSKLRNFVQIRASSPFTKRIGTIRGGICVK